MVVKGLMCFLFVTSLQVDNSPLSDKVESELSLIMSHFPSWGKRWSLGDKRHLSYLISLRLLGDDNSWFQEIHKPTKATIIIFIFKGCREGLHARLFRREHRVDRLGIKKSHIKGTYIYENNICMNFTETNLKWIVLQTWT